MRLRSSAKAVLLALTLSMSVTVTSPAHAETPPPEHCAVIVTGRAPDGELHTTKPFCDREPAVLDAVAHAIAPASFALGVHYDLPALGGASITVFGDDCTGGFLNLEFAWTNRISSTQNGCPRVRHFDGYNLTGGNETTTGLGGSLVFFNNRANSIQYLA